MIIKTEIVDKRPIERLIICLPGRGGRSKNIAEMYSNLNSSLAIGLEPASKNHDFVGEWYPRPNGPNDQQNAVNGLEANIPYIKEFVQAKIDRYEPKQTFIVGFSAGAVVALRLSFEMKFAGCIAHSGAILDSTKFPKDHSKNRTLITHSINDDVFSYENRFIPMKRFLSQTLPVESFYYSEFEVGGHHIGIDALRAAYHFINNEIKYG